MAQRWGPGMLGGLEADREEVCRGRADRAKRPVLARFIGLAGSLDEAITAVLRRKTRLLAEFID